MKNHGKSYIRDGRAPIPENEVTSKVMSGNKGKNTKPELLLRKALWSKGVKGYRLNWKKVSGRPDIAFPRKKLAIFVNGCFWHRCDKCSPNTPKTNVDFWNKKFHRNIERDHEKEAELIGLGWKVLVVWECEIKGDLQGVAARVLNNILYI
jgi:DNA mismatch endonuclease (patch repair protein)